MAMLAEPRKRKRYNLVPKGKPLFEDSDRFGTKMLEKMGWSKGKGLGSREDGQQEFVRVRYKNDANGLGFEDRDDQWTQHEQHFNGLLEKLNGKDPNTIITSDECEIDAPAAGFGFESKKSTGEQLKDKFSGQSLEEKSKNSRARVHYKKFTRSKDVTQYSEADLANIFGKKATATDTNIFTQFQAFNTLSEDKEVAKAENLNDSPIEQGTQIVNTGVSVSDYFKNKMAALKEKKASSEMNKEKENYVENETLVKTKKNKKRSAEVKLEELPCVSAEITEEVPRKKKKNKKQGESEIKTVNDAEELNQSVKLESVDSVMKENTPLKKKKNKKMPVAVIESDYSQKDVKKTDDEVVKSSSSKKKIEKGKHKKGYSIEKIEFSELTTVPVKEKKSKQEILEERLSKVSSSNQETEPENTLNLNGRAAEKPAESADIVPITNRSIKAKPQKKNKKNKSKLNSYDLTPPIEVSAQRDLNHLKDNCLLDTYTISTFCAEKFRNVDLHQFNGSNILEVNGYGLCDDLKLDIRMIKNDQQRIMQLWSGTLDKYQYATPKRKIYNTYMTKASAARRAKNRIPKMKVKCLKRKHVFQCI